MVCIRTQGCVCYKLCAGLILEVTVGGRKLQNHRLAHERSCGCVQMAKCSGSWGRVMKDNVSFSCMVIFIVIFYHCAEAVSAANRMHVWVSAFGRLWWERMRVRKRENVSWSWLWTSLMADSTVSRRVQTHWSAHQRLRDRSYKTVFALLKPPSNSRSENF